MRLETLAMISILLGLSFNQAFSQSEPTPRKNSGDFYRENSAAPSKNYGEPIRVAQRSNRQSDAAPDSLTEILRQKQMELDATQIPAKKSQPRVHENRPMPAPSTTLPSRSFAPPPASNADADDRLSEILRQKQRELDARSQPATRPARRAVEPQPRVKELRPAEIRPVPATPTVSRPATVAQPEGKSPAQDSLLEILRRKQNELDAREGEAPKVWMRPQPSVQPTTPVVSPTRPRGGEVQPVFAAPPVSQPAIDAASEEQLAQILRAKEAELDAKERVNRPLGKPAAAKSASGKKMEESEKRIQKIEADIRAKEEAMQLKRSGSRTGVSDAPIYSPPPDPSTKEGRLAELLRRYKADEITPHDYHLERAKIIAEP